MDRTTLICALVCALAPVASLAGTPGTSGAAGTAGAAVTDAAGTRHCLPSRDGYLRVRLRGASNLDIDWRDDQMRCDGDLRPDRRGMRLTFAGPAQPGNHRLRFVFGIDAAARAGTARNVAASVTVIFEGERRLYSTLGPGKCTVDRLRLRPLDASAHTLRVSARGFCIAAATAVDGSGDLLVTRFDFLGPVQRAGAADPAH